MAQIVLELNASLKHEFKYLLLYQLKQIHPINNRESAKQATNIRAETIQKNKQNIIKNKKISKETLAKLMPSITYIRVTKDKDNKYYTFEGNGRIAALKKILKPEDQIKIEVEIYHPIRKTKIQKN